MPKNRDSEEFNPDFEEDECCLECGEYRYTPSKKIPGVCHDCALINAFFPV